MVKIYVPLELVGDLYPYLNSIDNEIYVSQDGLTYIFEYDIYNITLELEERNEDIYIKNIRKELK